MTGQPLKEMSGESNQLCGADFESVYISLFFPLVLFFVAHANGLRLHRDRRTAHVLGAVLESCWGRGR